MVKFGFLWFILALSVGWSQEIIPLYQVIPGASAAIAGPGDSLYVLSTPALIPPTAGSWISSCPKRFGYSSPEVTLAKISSDLKTVYWSTCVPFISYGNTLLRVDPRTQDVLIAGTPISSFVSDAGATLGAGVPNQTAVVRIKSDGSAADLALLFPSEASGFGFNGLRTPVGFEVLSDGTFVVGFQVENTGLPVTSNAVSSQGPGYLIHFGADSKQILYASYLGGSISAMSQGPGGKIWLAGQIARDRAAWGAVQTRLRVPFASETMLDNEIFVSQFEPASSAFLSFARVGFDTSFRAGPKIGVGKSGRAVLVFQGGARFQEFGLVGFEVDELGTSSTIFQRIAASTRPQTLAFDAQGNWVVADQYILSPPPVTAGSTRFPNQYGESSLLRLSGTGKGLLSATVVQDQEANSVVTGRNGILYITASAPYATPLHPEMTQPEPVSLPRPTGSFVLYAYPKTVEVCTSLVPPQWILWDVREVAAETTIELHAGTANGPLLATGSTGVLTVLAGNNSYVLVRNPNGGPFAQPQTLATETTSLTIHPLRCSYVAQPKGEVIVRSNPVLGCATPVNTGNVATISGSLDDRVVLGSLPFIRVGKPTGTVFTSNLAGELTKDWVRNGMEFFLAMDSTPDEVIASQRAYVLPIRDCQDGTPPPPAISATRDCVKQTTFTLAFATGEPDPVAIRENAPDGPVIALQDEQYVGGVVDVTTTVPKRYYLTMLMNGVWQPLASVVAEPRQACGQGILQ